MRGSQSQFNNSVSSLATHVSARRLFTFYTATTFGLPQATPEQHHEFDECDTYFASLYNVGIKRLMNRENI